MLHIWLPAQHSQLYVWLAKQQQWQVHENWQSVSEHFSDRSVCLYFPSCHCLQVDSELSASQLKQLGNSGKQYLFEEMSLSSVEQLQVRQVDSAGHHYLYATANSDIDQWQNSASLVGIDIQLLLPDFLLLPIPESASGKVYLYHDQHTCLLRQSESQGMAVSFLPLVIKQMNFVDELHILRTPQAVVNAGSDSIQYDTDYDTSQLDNELSHLQILHSHTQIEPKPIDNPNRHPLNFMVRESKSHLSPYLKASLMVAVLALVTHIIADGMSLRQYTLANKATSTAIQQQFKAWFPNDRLNTRTNLQAQLQPMLVAGTQVDEGAMGLFARVSPLIQQSSLTAKSLLIEGDNISLQLEANTRNQLDGFINQLQQQGIQAQLGAVTKANQTKVTSEDSANNSPTTTTKIVGEVLITQAT